MWSKLKNLVRYFQRELNEFLSIPLGLLLFFLFPKFIRLIDNTSAPYDAGVLHSFIAAISGMLIIHGFVWILLRITFPRIYKFLDDKIEALIDHDPGYNTNITEETKQNTLSQWQKTLLSFSVFSLYLISTVLLARIF